MSADAYEKGGHGNGGGGGGCCGGGKDAGQTFEQLERELHALWARVQQERTKQAEANGPVKKKGCCCG
jgi:hypothetical protein